MWFNYFCLSLIQDFWQTENLYKKYVFLDPLARVVTHTNQATEGEDRDQLFNAPLSITKREQLVWQTAENYFYVPDLGQVPEIEVPYYLPDLPGVASNLADLGPGIAPSAPGGPIPKLPTFSTKVVEPSKTDVQDWHLLPTPATSFSAASPSTTCTTANAADHQNACAHRSVKWEWHSSCGSGSTKWSG